MEDNTDIFAENTAQFDAYLRGELPRDARQVFEKRLATDAQFRRDFDLHRALLGSMKRNAEREQWRQRLRDARKKEEPEGVRPEMGHWWLLALLLVLAGGLYWFVNSDAGKGKKNDPSVPIAGQNNEDRQPPPYGADGLEPTTREIPVLRIVVRDGQKTAPPDDTKASLEIFQTKETQTAGNIRGNHIQLYLPENLYRASETYRLLRLNKDGAETAFLQMGTAFYMLPAEDGYLEKVVDMEVLRWLR